MEHGTAAFYQRLGIKPGARLLDVACGAGQLALIAAREGARATGCDIAINWLEKARERAQQEKLDVTFEEADAEALPYGDSQFDVVTSFVGAMFAPRPDLAATELIRVCRPGGVIALANWTARGFIGLMLGRIAKYVAPSGMPSPLVWGDEVTVRNRMQPGIAELNMTPRLFRFEYPFPPQSVVEYFRRNYGPMSRAFASVDAKAQAELHDELLVLWSEHNTARNGGTTVAAEYLEVIARRQL
jgi:SAM-dependent methyltransferase